MSTKDTKTCAKCKQDKPYIYCINCDECAICGKHLNDYCSYCDVEHGIKCGVAVGNCLHTYHQHCIEQWLEKRKVCPLDNITWEYKVKCYVMISLQEMLCEKIANDTQMILNLMAKPNVLSVQDWKWINKYSKSSECKSPEWMSRDMKEIMAKHFHEYALFNDCRTKFMSKKLPCKNIHSGPLQN